MDTKTKEAFLAVLKMSLDLHARVVALEMERDKTVYKSAEEASGKIEAMTKNYIAAFNELLNNIKND